MRDRFARTTPLWPVGDDGRCTCNVPDCTRPGKHPDERAPGPGYAVETGAETGIVVIDPDVKGGVDGLKQLEALEKALGDLPKTLTVWTGSDGLHLYFKHPGFHVGNVKLDTAIDVRGDKASEGGFVYVVGPGSPGYVKTSDPCVVEESHKYQVDPEWGTDIAELPEAWKNWLRTMSAGAGRAGVAVEPIDESHRDWDYRIGLGAEACLTMPECRADGEAGKRLFALSLRLVRGLELPVEKALELVLEHFNPRCTDVHGKPYPWSPDDILHKLEDATRRSDLPTGIPSRATTEGIKAMAERLGNPNRTPVAPPSTKQRTKTRASDAYDGERVKVTRAGLTQMLFNWPDWDGVLWYDVLAQKPRATDPPVEGKMTLEQGEISKGDFALIAHWLDVKGFLASKELIEDALWTVVRDPSRQRNLIAEYLDALPQVTEATVLPTLATEVFGCEDASANPLLMKTLIAAVRRARAPGHFHKGMLVMKGDQGCGKTPAVKILAGAFYHSTGNGNLADRDTILECQGKSLVEVEELSAMGKADENALKTAISRTADVITKKYEPDGRTYPRSFVLIGTTNKDEFLTDSTGNARYHVIEVGKVNLARLEELRDVIWAEADFLARTTPANSNELDDQQRATLDEKNKAYLNTHPWESEVAKYLAGKTEVASASEVLMHILKGDATKADTRSKNAVADLMRTLGCESKVKWRGGKAVKVWTVPSDLPARASSPRASLALARVK